MTPTIVKTEKEVEAQLQLAEDTQHNSRYPAMSYEQGMIAMYEWLVGDVDDEPIEKD